MFTYGLGNVILAAASAALALCGAGDLPVDAKMARTPTSP
jgi:hypothetical protein